MHSMDGLGFQGTRIHGAQELDDAGERDKFQSTIPAQLGVIWGTLQAGDEAAAQEALELFIEMAEAHPRFLRRSLADIASAMLQVRARCLPFWRLYWPVRWGQAALTALPATLCSRAQRLEQHALEPFCGGRH